MTSIKNTLKGSIELLIILPIMGLLIAGVGVIGLHFIERGRLESSSWFYAISKIHHADEVILRRELDEFFVNPKALTKLNVSTEKERKENLFSILYQAGDLPSAFKIEVVRKSNEIVTLERKTEFDFSIQRLFKKLGISPKVSQSFSKSNQVEITTSDFSHHRLLKEATWLEGMYKSGFGALPLELLAIPELLSAAKAAAGMSLDGAAEELLQKYSGFPSIITKKANVEDLDALFEKEIERYGSKELDQIISRANTFKPAG